LSSLTVIYLAGLRSVISRVVTVSNGIEAWEIPQTVSLGRLIQSMGMLKICTIDLQRKFRSILSPPTPMTSDSASERLPQQQISQRYVRISKYLSKHLRHQPERLGLELLPGGWVEVDKLLAAASATGFEITLADLQQVVATNDKQRFGFNDSGDLIRANQGHSVSVDLQLAVQTPPATLYHGTYLKAVTAILTIGLQKMSRHHVHLTTDLSMAIKVGGRRGESVVFSIDTLAMVADGYRFYCSENDVWLVEAVPPQYLHQLS
jgi:putative RNA 2'-phosphotransferase